MTSRIPRVPQWARGRIIDVHCHIGVDQRFLLDGSMDRVVNAMDRYGIAKAAISSTLSLLYDFREGNRHVYEAVRKYAGRFIGLATINPLYVNEALRELKYCISSLGMRGIKLHPDYFGIKASHPLVEPILEMAIELGVPVMIHSYDGGEDVSLVADKFPDLSIVMYHMGGVRWREGIERVSGYDNVYLEISSSVCDCGMMEYAVRKLGSERILFGTDMPYQDPAVSLGKVFGARISDEDRENILIKNAIRVLGKE